MTLLQDVTSGSKTDLSALKVGCLYSRLHKVNVTETAQIIALSDDHAGVRHVRFSLVSSMGSRVMDCGTKLLAVDTFLDTYSLTEKPVLRPTNITHLKSHI